MSKITVKFQSRTIQTIIPAPNYYPGKFKVMILFVFNTT